MPVIDNKGWQATLTWSNPGWFRHNPQNVFGIYLDQSDAADLDQASAEDVADDFEAAWVTASASSAWTSTLKPVNLSIRNVNAPEGSQLVVTTPVTVTTSGSGDSLPAEIALVTTIGVDVPGLRKRGRWYWPAMTEGQNGLGVPAATAITITQGILTAFDANLNARAGYDGLGVISRIAGHMNQANSFITNATWDSQRRRGLR